MINRGISHLYKYALIWVGKEGVPAGEHFIDGRYFESAPAKAGWRGGLAGEPVALGLRHQRHLHLGAKYAWSHQYSTVKGTFTCEVKNTLELTNTLRFWKKKLTKSWTDPAQSWTSESLACSTSQFWKVPTRAVLLREKRLTQIHL